MTRRSAAGGFARLQSAIPLLVVYFALAALYAWQASRRPVPTIFTDELELRQLSRAIAETGEPARRGVPYGLASLVAYFLAPVWWLGSTTSAYATAKLLLVLAMTATIFPAYGLARLVVRPWYALAAAGAAVAVPALAYSPIFVDEPLAYPLSTLALWLIAQHARRAELGPRCGRAGCVGRGDAHPHAARRPLRRSRPRPPLVGVGLRDGTPLALDLDSLGLARRDRPRHRCGDRVLRGHGARVDELAEHDRLLQGAHPRPRRRRDRCARDRHRHPSAARRGSPRSRARRANRTTRRPVPS